MREFTVKWEIQVSAFSELEAALRAQEIQRDREAISNVFSVSTSGGPPELVDLDQTPIPRKVTTTFEDIEIGGYFEDSGWGGTWVKVSDTMAVCVADYEEDVGGITTRGSMREYDPLDYVHTIYTGDFK